MCYEALCLLKSIYVLGQLNYCFSVRAMLNIPMSCSHPHFVCFLMLFYLKRWVQRPEKIFCRQLVVIMIKLEMLLSRSLCTHLLFIVDWATAVGRKWGSNVQKDGSFCPMATAIPTDKWHSYTHMECRKNMLDVNQCYGHRSGGCLNTSLVYNMQNYYQTTTESMELRLEKLKTKYII